MTLTVKPFEQCDGCGDSAIYDTSYGRKRGTLTAGLYCAHCSKMLWQAGAFRESDYWLQTRLNVALPLVAVTGYAA